MKKFLSSLWEIIEVVLIAIVAVFIIRNFLAQPFLVSGASMEPNFSDGNYLLVDEITYRFREPARGEVIVLRFPQDRSTFFIKRIIGLPDERVVIRDGHVRIFDVHGNEIELSESYILTRTTIGSTDVKLGSDEYFVLGDNRSNSFDSRNWGSVNEQDIVGVVRLRLFPFNEIGAISAPSY